MFSTLPKTGIIILATLNLSSANAFNLVKAKILLFGKGLTKLKAFADNKINVTEKLKFVLDVVENIMGKGENAGYQQFLLFPQCFPKASFSRSSKVGIVW